MNRQSLQGFHKIKRASLGETVYEVVAGALMKGALKPDSRLRIRDLAEAMGTSVTPVREAILRLIQEGALELRSARDIRVPVLAAERYLEIRCIRLELEALAARTAAVKATPGDIAYLEELVEENESALAKGDFARATELNQIFHFALTEIADMPTLRGILHSLWIRSGPSISAIYEAGGRAMIDHHIKVLDALRAGAPEEAAEAIREDILVGGQLILQSRVLAAEEAVASNPAT